MSLFSSSRKAWVSFFVPTFVPHLLEWPCVYISLMVLLRLCHQLCAHPKSGGRFSEVLFFPPIFWGLFQISGLHWSLDPSLVVSIVYSGTSPRGPIPILEPRSAPCQITPVTQVRGNHTERNLNFRTGAGREGRTLRLSCTTGPWRAEGKVSSSKAFKKKKCCQRAKF